MKANLGQDTTNNSVTWAIKFCNTSEQPGWAIGKAHSEIRVLQNIQSLQGEASTHIVKYYDAYNITISNTTWLVVCMERCAGTLSEFLESQFYAGMDRGSKITGIWDIARQIATALRNLQSTPQQIMHRDIKPANGDSSESIVLISLVFFDREELPDTGEPHFVFKPGDFGLGRVYSPGQTQFVTPIPLTPNFQDPIMSTGRPYNTQVDDYCLGCIMEQSSKSLSPPDAVITAIHTNLRGAPELRLKPEDIIAMACVRLEVGSDSPVLELAQQINDQKAYCVRKQLNPWSMPVVQWVDTRSFT